MNGYKESILRIDLSKGKILKEKLNPFLKYNYLGGKGFGFILNYYENSKISNSLKPDNKMIFVLGSGAGTIVPTTTKMGLYAKAPLNNVGLDAYLGGSFGFFMKKAGYDILIIEGKSDKPVYIKIINESISIESADNLWGKDIYETESILI